MRLSYGITHAVWACADPGLQYDTTINEWHTCPEAAALTRQTRVQNIFLDDTACNLASLNLMQFRHADGSFDIQVFEHAVRLWTITLETSVLMAQFPSKEIAQGSYDYCTLGLGFANIGGLRRRPVIHMIVMRHEPRRSDSAIMTGRLYL